MIINIGRKEAVFFGVIVLVFVLAGIAIAITNDPTVFGHPDNGPIHIVGDNVGIGKDIPDYNLHVADPLGDFVAGSGWYGINKGTTGAVKGVGWTLTSAGIFKMRQFSDSVDGTTLRDVWAIDNSGKVGIGTTSPIERLDVVGNIKASGTICDGNGDCVGGGSGPATGSVVGGGSQGSGYSCTGSVWGSAFCSGANVACPSGSTRRRSGKYFNDIGEPKADFYFCIQN